MWLPPGDRGGDSICQKARAGDPGCQMPTGPNFFTMPSTMVSLREEMFGVSICRIDRRSSRSGRLETSQLYWTPISQAFVPLSPVDSKTRIMDGPNKVYGHILGQGKI